MKALFVLIVTIISQTAFAQTQTYNCVSEVGQQYSHPAIFDLVYDSENESKFEYRDEYFKGPLDLDNKKPSQFAGWLFGGGHANIYEFRIYVKNMEEFRSQKEKVYIGFRVGTHDNEEVRATECTLNL